MITDINLRELTSQEQQLALEIARKSIQAKLNQQDYQPAIDKYPIFQTKRGVFVTLHINKQLRGCIGTFEPKTTLAETIQEMTISAAFNDPRFSVLNKEEFDQIKIEISVLSPMEKIDDPSLVEVGKHGVYIQQGARSGVYLPQVATDASWTREQFLDHLCEHKAEIHKDSWRDGSADLYIFTAQIFNENRQNSPNSPNF